MVTPCSKIRVFYSRGCWIGAMQDFHEPPHAKIATLCKAITPATLVQSPRLVSERRALLPQPHAANETVG